MRGIPTLLLLFGLSTVSLEKSIIDRLVANQATNSEQKIVLESVATILSRSPKQHYKYELVKIIGKNLRNPTNIGGNVSEKAVDNIREVFKKSENPKNVLEFLEICMDYLKKSNKNEALKLNFIDRCVEKLEGNLNFEDIKTLIETGRWILPTETSDYLGIQILQTPPPIIDRMIENEANLMEKRLIFFELKTIMNFAKSSSYKHTLYTIIRKNEEYGDPDNVGGPISMQAIQNIQNALQMSENPKAFLEFLDICMDFLKSPATEDPPKWIFLHEAVVIIDQGYGMEDVKKSLMDEPSNVLESIFEALGIPERKDTTPNDTTTNPITVATDSPDLSGGMTATPYDNTTTTESSMSSNVATTDPGRSAASEGYTASPITDMTTVSETTTRSLPTSWDEFKDRIEIYVKEHPILLSDQFSKIFEIPRDRFDDYLFLLYFFANSSSNRDFIEVGFRIMTHITNDEQNRDADFWRMLTEVNQLDLKLLMEFFKMGLKLFGNNAADFYHKIWPNAYFLWDELQRGVLNLKDMYNYETPYTKQMIDAFLDLINLYFGMELDVQEKIRKMMEAKPEECKDTLYEDFYMKDAMEIQKIIRKFDANFGTHSCYHSTFSPRPVVTTTNLTTTESSISSDMVTTSPGWSAASEGYKDPLITNTTTVDTLVRLEGNTTTSSSPDFWDQRKDRMKKYVDEHPVLLSSEFSKLFNMSVVRLHDHTLFLESFASSSSSKFYMKRGLEYMIFYSFDKSEGTFWKMLIEVSQLDLNFLSDFFMHFKYYLGSKAVDKYPDYIEKEKFDRMIANLDEIDKIREMKYTESMVDAVTELTVSYWSLKDNERQSLLALMTVEPGACSNELYRGLYLYLEKFVEIREVMQTYDEAFGHQSCYNSTFLALPATPAAAAWNEWKDKMENYVKEHPVLLSDQFSMFTRMPYGDVAKVRYMLITIGKFGKQTEETYLLNLGLNAMASLPHFEYDTVENVLRAINEIMKLDNNFLWDFFDFSKDYNRSEIEDFLKKFWPTLNFGIEELNDVTRNLATIRSRDFLTKPQLDAVIELFLYLKTMPHQLWEKIKDVINPEVRCKDELYNAFHQIQDIWILQKILKKFDAAFDYQSCYHSTFRNQ